MRIITPEDAPARRAPAGGGRRVRVLASRAPGLPARAGMLEVEIAPGAMVPSHVHEHSEALVYVVCGAAHFRCDGRDELVTQGGVVHLPVGAELTIANRGEDVARLLVVLTPGGFERRFLDWEPAHPAAGAPSPTAA
jgi:quercetin dioxygenase-like cupin family protein